jgi:hypothetical protein
VAAQHKHKLEGRQAAGTPATQPTCALLFEMGAAAVDVPEIGGTLSAIMCEAISDLA